MGKILCSLCLKKKQAKKLIFDPRIAMRTERSDPARNHQFCADFLNVRLQCSQLLRNCAKIKAVNGRARGELGPDIAQTIGLNCSMTHSPGRIEYNCRYFLMTIRKRIRKNKFSKNDFHTLQGTMSHRPLTNTSSLKITAAQCVHCTELVFVNVYGGRESIPRNIFYCLVRAKTAEQWKTTYEIFPLQESCLTVRDKNFRCLSDGGGIPLSSPISLTKLVEQ